MASTITLANTVNWAAPHIRYAPLAISTNSYEPAVTIANVVKQTILNAPFTWRWNRGTATFNTVANTQDYSVAVSDFGFVETASVLANQSPPAPTYEVIQYRNILGQGGTDTSRPTSIAAQLDDNAGNITFRLLPVPDAVYTVNITYQKKATLFPFTGTTSTWAPIPDEYQFVYQQGFLAMTFLYWDDPRWQVEVPRFLSSLVGISEGLDDTQKNIFLQNWIINNVNTLQPQVRATIRQQGDR